MSLEEFVNRIIFAVDQSDKKMLKGLVLGQKENSEQAVDWFLEKAMTAYARDDKEGENTAVLIAMVIGQAYRDAFDHDVLISKVNAYQNFEDEKKKMLVRGQALIDEGIEKEGKGMYSESITSYQAALSAFEHIKDISKAGLAYLYLGDVYHKMQQYQSARQAYNSALSCFMKTGEEEKKALVFASLGRSCFMQGEYQDALGYLEESLKIYHSLKNKDAERKIQQNIEAIAGKIKNIN
jgi:tetratricopeptide (TPR) repeat protein